MLWNIDVALMAVVYFALGYYMKRIWMNITKPWIIAGLIGSVTTFSLDWYNVIDYHLSMIFLRYDHFILDVLIPLSFMLVFVGTFQFIASHTSLIWLQRIEKHSLSIMYLYIFVNIVLKDFFNFGIVGYTLFGLIMPIAVSILIQKWLPFGNIFLGGFSTKRRKSPIVP